MKQLAQIGARYGEIAPQAAVCCNACRTCVQTNALALATALVVGVVRRVRRRAGAG